MISARSAWVGAWCWEGLTSESCAYTQEHSGPHQGTDIVRKASEESTSDHEERSNVLGVSGNSSATDKGTTYKRDLASESVDDPCNDKRGRNFRPESLACAKGDTCKHVCMRSYAQVVCRCDEAEPRASRAVLTISDRGTVQLKGRTKSSAQAGKACRPFNNDPSYPSEYTAVYRMTI